MYFGLSEDQIFFQDNVKKFLEDQAPLDSIKKITEGENLEVKKDLHQGLISLGINNILIPESNGGLGLDLLFAIIAAVIPAIYACGKKPNKLPGKVIGVDYNLEYGQDRLEMQQDQIKKHSRILLIDDLLATGGTASAATKLIRQTGGELIGYCFLVELTKLGGRKLLDQNLFIKSVLKY